MASTATKESWKEIVNNAGGCHTIIASAANARELSQSWRRPIQKPHRNTDTIIMARWVEGESPARIPYTSTGERLNRDAALRLQPRSTTAGTIGKIHVATINAKAATMPTCKPEMASTCPKPVRLNLSRNPGEIWSRCPKMRALSSPTASGRKDSSAPFIRRDSRSPRA